MAQTLGCESAGAAAYSMTRVITSSPALWTGAGVERRLRVVLDHQLAAFGGRAVDEQLDEAQRHVDAARHAGGRDDPLVEVLDHPLLDGVAPYFAEEVAGAPVRRRRQPVEQAGGGEHERAGAHRRRERRRLVGRADPVEHPLVVHQGRVPMPPGNTMTSGVGHSSNVASTSMPRKPLSERTTPRSWPMNGDVEAGDALQHLVRADAVERGEAGNRGWRCVVDWWSCRVVRLRVAKRRR